MSEIDKLNYAFKMAKRKYTIYDKEFRNERNRWLEIMETPLWKALNGGNNGMFNDDGSTNFHSTRNWDS